MDHDSHDGGKRGFFASRANIVLIAFLAIGGYYLVTEHWAHLNGLWPLLFVIPCLVMHLFMHHGGHGKHGGTGEAAGGSPDSREDAPPHQH